MTHQEKTKIMDLGSKIYFKFVKSTIETPRDAEILFQLGLLLKEVYLKEYSDGELHNDKSEFQVSI